MGTEDTRYYRTTATVLVQRSVEVEVEAVIPHDVGAGGQKAILIAVAEAKVFNGGLEWKSTSSVTQLKAEEQFVSKTLVANSGLTPNGKCQCTLGISHAQRPSVHDEGAGAFLCQACIENPPCIGAIGLPLQPSPTVDTD